MMGVDRRVGVNVLTVLIVSVMLVIGAFLSFISGVLFDDTYEIRVPMHEAGGVQPRQEVTVLGRAVGQVDEVEITMDGVLLTLSIDAERKVPDRADVRVLRRSPIGEQAVDFQPLEAGWTAAEPDSTVVPREATTPAPVPFLLEQTAELFEAIEPADVSVIVHELSEALDGRGERLRNLNRDSLELARTLVGGIPEFDRLLDTSEPVLAALRDHREALASSFGSGADLAEIFAEQRPNLEDLLDSGERALDQTDVFVRNTRADLSCLTRDLTEFNELLLGPSTYDGPREDLYDSKLEELERLLVNNRYFFDLGFNIIAQPDPKTGLSWVRVHFVLDQAEEAMFYDEPRPTPPVLPGAACTSDAWGLGVNAVRQPDPAEPHPTSPGIDYAPLVEGTREQARPSTAGSGDREASERRPGTTGEPSGGGDPSSTAPDRSDDDEVALETHEPDDLADTGSRVVDLIAVGVPLAVLGTLALVWRRRRST